MRSNFFIFVRQWFLRYNLLALAMLFFSTFSAYAVPVTRTYNVPHGWDLDVRAGVAQAFFAWDLLAVANPATPDRAHNVNTIGPLAPPQNITRNANVGGNSQVASADANCTFTTAAGVAQPGGRTRFSGTSLAHGRETIDRAAGGRLAEAQSTCDTAVTVRTVDGQGRAHWTPAVRVSHASNVRDPVSFRVTDLDTGDVFVDEFLAIDMVLEDDAGVISWENGHVSVNGTNGLFSVVIDSPFITSINDTPNTSGILTAEFIDGLMTTSITSGIFSGLLPAVGETADFSFSFGDANGAITMDFDFGPENTNGYDFEVNWSGSGRVADVPEPETSFLVLLGLASLGLMGRRRKHVKGKIGDKPRFSRVKN